MKRFISNAQQRLSVCVPMIGLLLIGNFAAADDFVVNVTTNKIRLYDAKYKQLDVLSAKEFKQLMTEHQTDSGKVTGIKIVERGNNSATLSVELPGHEQPVWLGLVGLELSDKERIPCPDGHVGKEQSSKPGVTIGFGDSCDAKE